MKKRLDVLLSFVKPCRVFADIGCDHGLVAVGVFKREICEKVIAADVSEGSLEKTIKLADNEGIDGLITVLSDGFKAIKEPVDQAMIAGMGGEEICKILSECENLPERLVLQPMKNAEKLRRLLVKDLRYPVTDDFTFFDGDKFYDVIVADRREKPREYREDDFSFGKDNLFGNEDFKRYAKNLSEIYAAAIEASTDPATKENLRSKLNKIAKYL